jgi:hypothetical protein
MSEQTDRDYPRQHIRDELDLVKENARQTSPPDQSLAAPAKRRQLVGQSDFANPYLADELLLVRDSGEIPEVALHGSIFFLSHEPTGPGIKLSPAELLLLKEMAAARYREIIRRDLQPGNRDHGSYRGLARCICNWQRLKRFCEKEGFVLESFRKEVAMALIALLREELFDIAAGRRIVSINCTALELTEFTEELGINRGDLPEGWGDICLADG